jgi:hypothetical protein
VETEELFQPQLAMVTVRHGGRFWTECEFRFLPIRRGDFR